MSLQKIDQFIRSHPLAHADYAGSWARFFRWQIQSRLKREHVVDWVGETKFSVSRGMTGFTGNIYAGLHEAIDMLFVAHFLRPGDLFGDIGANVGSYTVLAAGYCGANVIAFEPDDGTADKLAHNISLNGLDKLASVQRTAVGDSIGTVSFTIGLDTVNRVSTAPSETTQEVPVTTLDQYFGDEPPIMLKLDVEGFEEHAIAGAKKILRSDRLQVVALETISNDIEAALAAAGFSPVHYDPFSRKLSAKPGKYRASNQLFVKDVELAKERLEAASPITVLGKSY